MYRHCGTNNRAPRWTFTDPCKPEVRPGAREETKFVHIISPIFGTSEDAFLFPFSIYTSMNMVSEYCNHVLAKYKSWFSPIELK